MSRFLFSSEPRSDLNTQSIVGKHQFFLPFQKTARKISEKAISFGSKSIS
jgi:hypothetical protein